MKIAGQYHAAFALNGGQAAVATHASHGSKCAPMVQIMNMGNGISVCGVEALEALRQAIAYAIDGPPMNEQEPES